LESPQIHEKFLACDKNIPNSASQTSSSSQTVYFLPGLLLFSVYAIFMAPHSDFFLHSFVLLISLFYEAFLDGFQIIRGTANKCLIKKFNNKY